MYMYLLRCDSVSVVFLFNSDEAVVLFLAIWQAASQNSEGQGGSNDLNSQIMQHSKKSLSNHLGQVDFPGEQVTFHSH